MDLQELSSLTCLLTTLWIPMYVSSSESHHSPLDAVGDLLVGELEAVLVLGDDLWRETRSDYE